MPPITENAPGGRGCAPSSAQCAAVNTRSGAMIEPLQSMVPSGPPAVIATDHGASSEDVTVSPPATRACMPAARAPGAAANSTATTRTNAHC